MPKAGGRWRHVRMGHEPMRSRGPTALRQASHMGTTALIQASYAGVRTSEFEWGEADALAIRPRGTRALSQVSHAC